MSDKSFKREQLRRDLQEVINTIDEAIACEEDSDEQASKDLIWCIKLLPITLDLAPTIELLSGIKKEG